VVTFVGQDISIVMLEQSNKMGTVTDALKTASNALSLSGKAETEYVGKIAGPGIPVIPGMTPANYVPKIAIAPGTAPEHLTALAISVHNIVGRMPVAIKARDGPGVLVAGGATRRDSYESDALGSVFTGTPAKKAVAGGEYDGIPMYVSSICDTGGTRSRPSA
jgi:hypothetical protein